MSDRRSLLRATLAFLHLSPRAPELHLLHRWLDSWAGLGLIVGGMRRLGYEIEFRQYPQGWRVNMRRGGVDPIVGSGWALMSWRAVQDAAWGAMNKEVR